MKRLLGLFALLFLLNACDDGKITVDPIDFSEVAAQKCSDKDLIYKVKGNEMLILAIPASTFVNDETLENSPIEVPINTSNQVVYRKYESTASANTICPTIPSATPNLREEWNAISGTIQITSTAIKSTNATTNATKITGYKHYIVLKNVTFQKPTMNQTYETFVFGNYSTTVSPLAFGFNDQVDKSTCDNRIFNFSGSEALLLDVEDYATLFESAVTTTPRTALISATNKLTYQLFSNVVNDAYFCTTPTPITPSLTQEWKAVDGIEATNGIIEVTTTTLGNGFQHTIHFKKVTLQKGNSNFYLGDDYLFGSFVTN